ncbi:hypothetical protein BDW67DRAFT_159596 [Aspergillus spinulosporus]
MLTSINRPDCNQLECIDHWSTWDWSRITAISRSWIYTTVCFLYGSKVTFRKDLDWILHHVQQRRDSDKSLNPGTGPSHRRTFPNAEERENDKYICALETSTQPTYSSKMNPWGLVYISNTLLHAHDSVECGNALLRQGMFSKLQSQSSFELLRSQR